MGLGPHEDPPSPWAAWFPELHKKEKGSTPMHCSHLHCRCRVARGPQASAATTSPAAMVFYHDQRLTSTVSQNQLLLPWMASRQVFSHSNKSVKHPSLWLGWLTNELQRPSCLPSSTGVTAHTTPGAGDPNSGPYACTVSTLPTGQSPNPREWFKKQNNNNKRNSFPILLLTGTPEQVK